MGRKVGIVPFAHQRICRKPRCGIYSQCSRSLLQECKEGNERRLYAPDDFLPILEETGGEWIAGSGSGTEFRDMMLHIRKRYTLYYGMPAGKPGAVRHIAVDVTSDVKKRYAEASVLARKGYVVPKGFPGRQ
jgi:hypothetical protein